LAFHLYPQVIPEYCNIHGFVPSLLFYCTFKLLIDRSLGFGSNIIILFRFHFAFARILILLAIPLYKRYILRSQTALIIAIFDFFFTLLCASFQLSLTLLLLYRCIFIFSLRGLVPLSSNRSSLFYSVISKFSFYGTLLPSLVFLLLFLLFFDSPWFARHYYWDLS